MAKPPVSVAAVNDYDLVVEGLAALLGKFPEQLHVRERFIIGEPVDNGPIDVALFDTYGRVGIAERALLTLTKEPAIRRVALFSLDFPSTLVRDARAVGVEVFISKTLPGAEIARALVRAAEGDTVEEVGVRRHSSDPTRSWPGRDDGLTERESQVLVLCAEGMTNREIAAALYVSLDTVKSHLQRTYRRLGLRNRAEATSYVHSTGAFVRFQPTAAVVAGDGEIDETPQTGRPPRAKRRTRKNSA